MRGTVICLNWSEAKALLLMISRWYHKADTLYEEKININVCFMLI